MSIRRLRRLLPNKALLRQHPVLGKFGSWLSDPKIWRFQRASVALALALGLFIAWIPMPVQMLIAGALAIWLRINLPVAVAAVWVTNPLTAVPMFYTAYRLGHWILDDGLPMQPEPLHEISHWQWLLDAIGQTWAPFSLGCFILGCISALLGMIVVNILYWLSWRHTRYRRAGRRRKAD